MKMHKDKAIVGDVVRSYDFKPMSDRGDSYIAVSYTHLTLPTSG